MTEQKTITCDECRKDIAENQGKAHAVTHWGVNLKKACEKNKDAEKRIRKLVGDAAL